MNKSTNNKSVRSIAVLSQLAGMLDCSLARYLSNARPWCRRPYLLLGALVRRLALEDEDHAGEVDRLLHARRHTVSSHTYPMEFTYYNDLSLEFLAPRLLDHQHRLIEFANAASEELKGDYQAQRMLGNVLASLRKYGALLEEILAARRLAPATSREVRPAAEIAGHAPSRAKVANVASLESQTAA
jgi:hypothetical protein